MRPKRLIYFFKLLIFIGLLPSSLLASKAINFKYWPYELEGCLNTRDTYLKQVSEYFIEYEKIDDKKCHVMAGKWRDYFTNVITYDATKIIVAPIIPIAHIKKVAPDYPFERLSAYVNDKDFFIHFKKGGSGERKYLQNKSHLINLPKKPHRNCEMLGRWIDAKIRWNIPFLEDEKSELTQRATTCLQDTGFNRIEVFGQWGRPYKKCSTRTEVLKRDSLIETTPMSGYEDAECTSQLFGKWFDPYTGKIFTSAHKLDIDHVVPLKHTYVKGGWKWPRHKRRSYSNHMTDPFHLIPIDLRENRAKRDLGPNRYAPPRLEYLCRYLNIWTSIKLRWRLSIDDKEKKFLIDKIKNCPGTTAFKRKFTKVVRMLASIP